MGGSKTWLGRATIEPSPLAESVANDLISIPFSVLFIASIATLANETGSNALLKSCIPVLGTSSNLETLGDDVLFIP